MDYQLFHSLITGISIGGAGYLGALMLTRRMALVAGPLGHLTLPGVALAILYGFNVSLGAFPFVIFGIVAIWWLEIRSRLPMEALTAIVFASGVAIMIGREPARPLPMFGRPHSRPAPPMIFGTTRRTRPGCASPLRALVWSAPPSAMFRVAAVRGRCP